MFLVASSFDSFTIRLGFYHLGDSPRGDRGKMSFLNLFFKNRIYLQILMT